MKTATLPSIRVQPELRTEIESVLGEQETLSEFVEAAVRAQLDRRRHQSEFVARGLAAIARTVAEPQTGIPADEVIKRLEARLAHARQHKQQAKR